MNRIKQVVMALAMTVLVVSSTGCDWSWLNPLSWL